MRMLVNLPLRVPLHAEGEAARLLDRERLDQSVRRQRLDAQTGSKPLDALAMHRVDLDLRRQAQPLE
jgi:hypothetical protein